jgi:hypothetical protein
MSHLAPYSGMSNDSLRYAPLTFCSHFGSVEYLNDLYFRRYPNVSLRTAMHLTSKHYEHLRRITSGLEELFIPLAILGPLRQCLRELSHFVWYRSNGRKHARNFAIAQPRLSPLLERISRLLNRASSYLSRQ